jgi:myo-inositol 2-dehydrogenase/D-chiro-inositol 1-dehydrogenase
VPRDDTHRIAVGVIGAGQMARRRARALLATGRVRLSGVAARRLESARELGRDLGVDLCVDDYRRLLDGKPAAVLVEVPHAVQDEVVQWALTAGLHVLIGGPLSSSSDGGRAIERVARDAGLVVEAGYESRYKAVWEKARGIIAAGALGRLVAVRAVALWPAPPDSWYYDESLSGGMPLTHLTYAFMNPLRWLLGEPTHVSAFANRKRQQGPHDVREETCVVNLLFEDDVLGSLMAGYVTAEQGESWMVSILGTGGSLDLHPTEMDNGALRLVHGGEVTEMDFAASPDAFVVQADAFVAAVSGRGRCRNAPADTVGDLLAVEAVVTSARERRTIVLGR